MCFLVRFHDYRSRNRECLSLAFIFTLHENPLVTLLFNADWPLLVEADSSRVQDGGGKDGVGDGRQPVINELLDRDV
ncbi:unnamed protein product, partial [Mycena citricolor]